MDQRRPVSDHLEPARVRPSHHLHSEHDGRRIIPVAASFFAVREGFGDTEPTVPQVHKVGLCRLPVLGEREVVSPTVYHLGGCDDGGGEVHGDEVLPVPTGEAEPEAVELRDMDGSATEGQNQITGIGPSV